MKKLPYLLAISFMLGGFSLSAQPWKKLKDVVEAEVPILSDTDLSQEDAGYGIMEALIKGIEKGVETVSEPDGYFKDPIIKILMPKEAEAVESKLRAIGQDQLVDDAIESMNRAAEDAAIEAKEIFVAAIKNLTFEDALSILAGEDDAATQYLKQQTLQQLTESFQPKIKQSLEKVNATKYWNAVFENYNKIPFVKKVNPDLEAYVTEKAIDGLFVQIAKEEKIIREDPAARTTELLQKVFGQ